MLIYPEFPPNRRQDPKRQAEWRVYQAFDESDRDGHALYELKVGRHAPEVDFFALIQDKVVVCMQVKGGQYRIIDGNWHLETDDGLEYTPCPMKLTWDSAMAVRDFLKEKLGRKIFMVAVLLLPDMEPDRDIEMIAESDKTSVMFGYRNIVERVVDLAEERDVYGTPSPQMSNRIIDALVPQLKVSLPDSRFDIPSEGEKSDLPETFDRPVEVHHADVVNVYNAAVTINNNFYGSSGDGQREEVMPS